MALVDEAFLRRTYQSLVKKLSGRERSVETFRFAGVTRDGRLISVEVQSRYVASIHGQPGGAANIVSR